MDFETAQILNLSPIPELSEIELSTILDQLSNLSDLNGDLTDGNVEDILKEAEDLLDNSINNIYIKSKISNQSVLSSYEKEGNAEKDLKNNASEIGEFVDPYENELDSNNKTCRNTEKNESNEKELQLSQIFSPTSPVNHIRSTIDSLKEYSNLMEKQTNKQLPKLTSKKELGSKNENYKINVDLTKNKNENNVVSPKSEIMSSSERMKSQLLSMNESIKLLNCFERLYQNRPSHKKLKTNDKVVSKEHSKGFRNSSTYNKERSQSEKKVLENEIAENVVPKSRHSSPNKKSERNVEELIKQTNKTVFTYSNQCNKIFQKKSKDDLIVKQIQLKSDSTGDRCCSDVHLVNCKTDDEVLLKLLQEIEEIKSQIKISAVSNYQHPGLLLKENLKIIDYLRSEIESVRLKVLSEENENENAAIKRLEEQFFLLKDKYDRQMEKLEKENSKLKESLQNRGKILQLSNEDSDENPACGATPKEISQSPRKCVSRCTSCENFQSHSNSSQPLTPFEETYIRTRPKEASSQTEESLRNTSTQCSEEEKKENIFKLENKENLSQKKKLGKKQPFFDIYQLMKQRKTITEHETQLLATLRGLQSELWEKNKELRKVKNECELLRRQIKRLGKNKMEGWKKLNNVGTQTIGLGPALQISYNPQLYQVPKEFEQENKELKEKIKTLEKNLEFVEEKRVLDLQSLHKVHEEEMGKVVSKLETQSALTKHLHSLLVSR